MSKELKALSIRGPWPWWIMQTEPWRKNVENRTHARTSYRGPLAIHVSKTMTKDEFTEACFGAAYLVPDAEWPTYNDVWKWLGCIVGVVDLVAVEWCPDLTDGWGEPDCYHWQLENPRLLATPVPARGCQACPWRVPPAIAEQVWAQLEEARP